MTPPKTQSILLIDDDDDDGFLFAAALRELDKSIAFVHYLDGEKALHDLKSFKLNPDCIFLDLNMPRMSGIEVLRELKTVKRLWHIPIIICSTTKNKEHIDTVMALGAEKFISKPNSIKDLVKEVRNAII